MSPRETTAAKARRYLTEGRLDLIEVAAERIRAKCHGSATYLLGWDAGGPWWCDCPAHGDCAHLHALRLVTLRSRP